MKRWVYGDRSDPSAALRRLSDRLQDTLDPAQVVATVTTSVAEALRVDHVAVVLNPAAPTAPPTSSGRPGRGSVVSVSLAYQGEPWGDLVAEVPPGRQLNAADRRLLDDLARHAGVVVNAVHLTPDLQRSRAELVTAQAEERRRLRRDLHDGPGPTLAAIVLKLNAVTVQAQIENPTAGQLVTELRTEARAAIAELRRLVDNLRSPALDEVGLVAVIRQQAASLSRPAGIGAAGGSPLIVDVEGPAGTPVLPAALEVAAYRIATEAMTNVVRHSGAARCLVTLTMNGAVEVRVADDGTGLPVDVRPGVGWRSMRERAAELGGTCQI